jgi:hypothetical protein
MPRVEFEHTISLYERANTFLTSDRKATVIGWYKIIYDEDLQEQLVTKIVYFIDVSETISAMKKHWILVHIQGVPGGMCQTSGGCSLC